MSKKSPQQSKVHTNHHSKMPLNALDLKKSNGANYSLHQRSQPSYPHVPPSNHTSSPPRDSSRLKQVGLQSLNQNPYHLATGRHGHNPNASSNYKTNPVTIDYSPTRDI